MRKVKIIKKSMETKELLNRLEELEKLISSNEATKRDCLEYTEIFRKLKINYTGINLNIKPEIRLIIDIKLSEI